MVYTKEAIDDLLEDIAKKLDISNKLFDNANHEYEALGHWIDNNTSYDVSIYSQGSFALGTVIKPISDEDDYDLDLVCELADDYGLNANELKNDVVKKWLEDYKRIDGEIEEKRRCWHVEYEDVPNFHMDVIPAIALDDSDEGYLSSQTIAITDYNENTNEYKYIGSNPAGYMEWFYERCSENMRIIMESYRQNLTSIREDAEIEPLDRKYFKTSLQRAVQLLKRHRDVMFASYPDEDEAEAGEISKADKPISILITTLVAELYENDGSIITTINGFADSAEDYIYSHRRNGEYYIENPSYRRENFADKWNINPLRKKAFFMWLDKVKEDFNYECLMRMNRVEMGRFIKKTFGEKIGQQVILERANEDRKAIMENKYKMDSNTGILSESGDIEIPKNHHHSYG